MCANACVAARTRAGGSGKGRGGRGECACSCVRARVCGGAASGGEEEEGEGEEERRGEEDEGGGDGKRERGERGSERVNARGLFPSARRPLGINSPTRIYARALYLADPRAFKNARAVAYFC